MGGAFGAAVLVEPSAAVLMLPLSGCTPTRGAAARPARGGGGRRRRTAASEEPVLVSVVPLRELVGSPTGQLAGTVQADARVRSVPSPEPPGARRLLRPQRRSWHRWSGTCSRCGARAWRRAVPRLVLVAWAAPYLAMCIFVHLPKPGDALPRLAPIALVLARKGAAAIDARCAALARRAPKRPQPRAIHAPGRGRSQHGGSTRYAAQELPQKLATAANAVIQAVARHDRGPGSLGRTTRAPRSPSALRPALDGDPRRDRRPADAAARDVLPAARRSSCRSATRPRWSGSAATSSRAASDRRAGPSPASRSCVHGRCRAVGANGREAGDSRPDHLLAHRAERRDLDCRRRLSCGATLADARRVSRALGRNPQRAASVLQHAAL